MLLSMHLEKKTTCSLWQGRSKKKPAPHKRDRLACSFRAYFFLPFLSFFLLDFFLHDFLAHAFLAAFFSAFFLSFFLSSFFLAHFSKSPFKLTSHPDLFRAPFTIRTFLLVLTTTFFLRFVNRFLTHTSLSVPNGPPDRRPSSEWMKQDYSQLLFFLLVTALNDFNQLHIENKEGTRLNGRGSAAIAIGKLRRQVQSILTSRGHQL